MDECRIEKAKNLELEKEFHVLRNLISEVNPVPVRPSQVSAENLSLRT